MARVPSAALLAACLCAIPASAATTLTVKTVNDSWEGSCGGTCSLRDAITAANLDSGDTIVFAPGVTGTISLQAGIPLPTISANVTITGPGANVVTVSSNSMPPPYQPYPVFNIASGVTAGISGLTIANGNYGGIVNNGTLTVTNCTLSGNASPGNGGGIYNGGALTVTGTVFSGNSAGGGGGIYNGGALTVTGSVFSGNSADDGGGIANFGTLSVTNSTFSGNSASRGGGISNSFGTLSVTDSTFSSNNASNWGGGIYSGGPLTVIHSTVSGNSVSISGNGGGIFNFFNGPTSMVKLANSIVAGNSAAGGADDFDQQGPRQTDDGGNFVGYSNGTQVSSGAISLAPLGNYGGPTQTMIPLPGSPAICNGTTTPADVTLPTTDQRGWPMSPSTCPSGQVDAGAVQTNDLTVTTLTDQTDSSPDCTSGTGNTCSLRDAITVADAETTNNGTGGDIGFAPALFVSGTPPVTTPGTINLNPRTIPAGTGNPLTITGQVNILGPGANLLTVSANDWCQVFNVNTGATASLYGLTIEQGNAALSNGGGIVNSGTLTVSNSTVYHNAAANGGGIYNGGILTVTGSTFSGSTATAYGGSGGNGGGIGNYGVLEVSGSVFSGNSAGTGNTAGNGGGIANGGPLTVTGSTFSGNSARAYNGSGGNGGGIANADSLTATNSTFSGNSASSGGGIANAGTVTMANSIAAGNTTGGVADSDDCDSCGTQDAHNLIGLPTGFTDISQILGSLASSPATATAQTMMPLPDSPSAPTLGIVCGGSAALAVDANGIPLITDERGFPMDPSCPSGAIDLGAAQTNYTAIAFLQQPTDTLMNQAISPAPIVEVEETNALTGAMDGVGGIPVTLALSPDGSPSWLSGTPTKTTGSAQTANGMVNEAIFGDLAVNAAGPYTLAVTAPVVGSPETSNSFNVIGQVTHFSVSATTPVTAGAASSVIVTALDAYGNTVLNNADQVNLTISGDNTYLATMTLSSGISSGPVTLTRAGAYTLTASAMRQYSISGTSNTVTVNPAGAAILTASGVSTPQTAYVNTAFATPLTVTVTDSYGNPLSGQTVTFTPPANGASAALSPSGVCTAAVDGTCSVMATANGTTGSYNVTAAVSGLSSVSFALTNNPAPNLVVTSTGDDSGTASNCTAQPSTTSGTDGSCSLRDALLEAANLQTANIYFDATVFAGAQTITLGAAGTLKIPPYTGITGPTTGSGATLTNLVTISGADAYTVFWFIPNQGTATASLANLNIVHGSGNYTGGGIYNNGSLTVTNCTLSGNSAPDGGGIYSSGVLTVINSTLSGNSVNGGSNGWGGGIMNGGVGILTVTNSTVSGNSATSYGGGILNFGTLTVTNSTVSGNSASVAAGGIGNAGTVTIGNSIVAGNTTGGVANSDDCDGCGTQNSHNLIGTLANPVGAPALGLLASSPATATAQTMMPLPDLPSAPALGIICRGSAALAVDANGNQLTSDERGFPMDPSCPSGAVDLGAAQTFYSAVVFLQQPTDTLVSQFISPAPTVEVLETNALTGASDRVGGIPVTLALIPDGSPSYLSGTLTQTTGSALTNGVVNEAIFGDLAVNTGGSSFKLAVTAPVVGSQQASNSFNVIGTAASLVVSGYPSPVYVTVPYTGTVTALDSHGGLASSFNGSVNITASGGSPIVSSPITVTNGVGTFTVAFATAGPESITASFAGLASTPQTGIMVNAAPSYVVTVATDDVTGDASQCQNGGGGANCTLRDAITAANAAGAGNIAFSGVTGTITLTSALPMLTGNIGITGPGANVLTVSGDKTYGVFTVWGATAGISGLTIANGFSSWDGGGIYNTGTLRVTDSTISGNSSSNGSDWGAGGGISNYGTLTVTDSTLSGNSASGSGEADGGGILNYGTLTVTNSTFSGNSASGGTAGVGDGGGIANYGTLIVTNSTFSGNSADSGIAGAGIGGGIFTSGTLTMTGSTFSGNSASGDASGEGDGGGMLNYGTLIMTNSIVDGNWMGTTTTVSSYDDLDDLDYGGAPTFTSAAGNNGGNVVGNYNSPAATAPAPAIGLSALGNYGGSTQTMIPLPGSVAICAGAYSAAHAAGITSDQRGVSFGSTGAGGYCPSGSVDAGAVQTNYALNFTAQQPTNVVVGATMSPAPIVSVTESGSAIAAASATVSVTDADSDLTGSSTTSASTSSGQASFGNLQFTLGETGDTLTATLALNPALTPPPSISMASSSFNVSQIGQTISFNPAVTSYTYSPSGTFAVSATASSSLAVSFTSTTGSVCSVTGSTVTILSAGTCTIQAGQAGNTDYSAATPVSVKFTINQVSQAISFMPPTSPVTYGVSPIALTATGGASGNAVSFSVISGPGTIGGSTLTVTGAGTIVIAADQAGSTNYTAATEVTAKIVVNQASQAISFTPSSPVTYGVSPIALTASGGASGNAISFSVISGPGTIGGSTLTVTGAGTIVIAADQAGSTNYTAATEVTAKIVVNPASQAISFTPSSPVTYGVPSIALTATGGASGNAVSFSVVSGPGTIGGSTLTVTGVGMIVIAADQAGNTNYAAATEVTAKIVVNQASLTIAANNATKAYGTTNPAFTGSVTGAVGGNSFTESFSTAATASSDVGAYAIVPSVTGAALSNYTQSITNGTLTVTQAATATSLSMSSGSITPGQTVTLTATVASAPTGTPTGTVSFYDNGTLLNAAPIALTTGTAAYATATLAPGASHAITATYSGDKNFTGSSSTANSSSTIVVAPLDFTMTLAGPAGQTVVPGSKIIYQVTVTPMYGSYAGTVNFAVSGLPPGATVTFSPSSIAVNGGPQTITVTIQTAPASAAAQAPPPRSSGRYAAPFALALLLLFGVGGLRKRGRHLLRHLICVALLLAGGAAATLMSGCGGGFFTQSPENYTVTITATCGTLQHSTSVTLNVQ